MKRKQLFKKCIRKIHLWLGLATGLVVFIVSLTGAIYVFEPDIGLLLQSGVYRNVEPQNKPFISPLEIREKSEEFFQRRIISMNATVYPEGDRATIVWVRDSTRKYTAIVQNPYSGEVIHSYPYSTNFWAIVLGLHTSLLIPQIGHHIVSISTLLYIILMISGIILWYPRRKKHLRQRLTIKWGASPKRLNYDLHNVLGFYMSWLAIFIILSGLILSYDWLKTSAYWIATGGETPTQQAPVRPALPDSSFASGIGRAVPDSIAASAPGLENAAEKKLLSLIGAQDDLDNYFLMYAVDSTDFYRLTLNTRAGYFYNRHDYYVVNQYTGEVLKEDLWENKNNGDRLLEANLNIHIGAILGFPGKVLAFFASLVSASLPVTGFLIWRGRKNKQRGKAGATGR